MARSWHSLGLLVLAFAFAACGQDDDPDGAKALLDKANASPGFQTWARAPGYATRMPSFTSHGNAVEIFVNPTISAALSAAKTDPPGEWPVGSIIVKESFSSESGGSRRAIAAMEKREGGWFWAEYDDSGKPTYSGHPSVCTDCHGHRKDYSDWVYAFELPR